MTCSTCHGRGTVILAFGLKAMEKPCPKCVSRRLLPHGWWADRRLLPAKGSAADKEMRAASRRCRRCEQPTPHTYGRGLCARCYLHHGGV